jgi:hypothetical protein
MGLLSHISAEESKKTGLLAKTSQLAAKPVFSSFSDFGRKYQFSHCALLSVVNGSFVMTHCYGIDARTVAASVSSRDFWDGTIGSSRAFCSYKKPDNKLSAFYQFFSGYFRERLKGLHILRISGDCIFLAADIEQYAEPSVPADELKNMLLNFFLSSDAAKKETLPDMNTGFIHCDAFLLLLSVKIAINSSIRNADIPDTTLYDSIFKTVYTELFSLLEKHLALPDFCMRSENGEMKIIIFSKKHFDDALLQYHIMRCFSSVLGSSADSVILLKAGTTSADKDVCNFVLEEKW